MKKGKAETTAKRESRHLQKMPWKLLSIFSHKRKKTSASFSFMRNLRREAEERMGLARDGIYYISGKKFYQHYFKLVGIPTFLLRKKINF